MSYRDITFVNKRSGYEIATRFLHSNGRSNANDNLMSLKLTLRTKNYLTNNRKKTISTHPLKFCRLVGWCGRYYEEIIQSARKHGTYIDMWWVWTRRHIFVSLTGLRRQGVRCKACKMSVHHKCRDNVPYCRGEIVSIPCTGVMS